jgi:ketosteroid isomerase-like protein
MIGSAVRVSLLTVTLAIASGCWVEVEEDAANLQSSVEAMLVRSAEAWNGGDLDGFMADYLEAETTTYIGGSGMLTGYAAIRDRYAPLFEPGAERDSLRFENIRVRRLGAVDGLITARWILHRGAEVTGSGPFTLVVRRTSSGWKIIHDHSSSDPRPPAGE